MLLLQRNVPPPVKPPVTDKRKKYPVERMEIGDFFFVAQKRRGSIRTYFSALGKQHGIKLRSEQIHARREDETSTWKPCEPDTPGAVEGVGVWRIE
jgi:hypothetical protein